MMEVGRLACRRHFPRPNETVTQCTAHLRSYPKQDPRQGHLWGIRAHFTSDILIPNHHELNPHPNPIPIPNDIAYR